MANTLKAALHLHSSPHLPLNFHSVSLLWCPTLRSQMNLPSQVLMPPIIRSSHVIMILSLSLTLWSTSARRPTPGLWTALSPVSSIPVILKRILLSCYLVKSWMKTPELASVRKADRPQNLTRWIFLNSTTDLAFANILHSPRCQTSARSKMSLHWEPQLVQTSHSPTCSWTRLSCLPILLKNWSCPARRFVTSLYQPSFSFFMPPLRIPSSKFSGSSASPEPLIHASFLQTYLTSTLWISQELIDSLSLTCSYSAQSSWLCLPSFKNTHRTWTSAIPKQVCIVSLLMYASCQLTFKQLKFCWSLPTSQTGCLILIWDSPSVEHGLFSNLSTIIGCSLSLPGKHHLCSGRGLWSLLKLASLSSISCLVQNPITYILSLAHLLHCALMVTAALSNQCHQGQTFGSIYIGLHGATT